MEKFKHEMEKEVKLIKSNEVGIVIGRAEYANGNESSYLIRYKASDGRQVEAWWNESAITAVE